ncbi:hypothetical protein K4K58_011373 [Colletotrichum sp. SAR11_239]|nr:hypothetical protein K4K58_011373 [Colletotrichum sp. SAR11_239]
MAELIIAYIGLYWLFTQSGQFSTDHSVQQTYLSYGSAYYILALTMADHSFDPETRQKSKLFWAMFILEKNLSLQLGRSSTLRDHDITVPLKAIKMGYQTPTRMSSFKKGDESLETLSTTS